jgi:hypothetical protein
MTDNDKLIKAASSENGKLIIEHLKERIEKLDLNKKAIEDLNKYSIEEIKAMATARKILEDEIRLLTGEIKEEDSILNYLH